jgi:hypothetical protein
MTDLVNHPKHYTSHPSGVEAIEITRHMGYNLGNVMKYIWRADLKNDAIQDLEKAEFYLADEIAKRKQAQASQLDNLRHTEDWIVRNWKDYAGL